MNPLHDLAVASASIRREGYAILRDVLSGDDLTALRSALLPALDRHFGRSDFEGRKTERVNTLVRWGKPFQELAEHPLILQICDVFLLPNYLLSAAQAIDIHPGEVPQAFHTDDSFYPVPRPRPAISLSTIWALDDFTEENGATRVIPGSHLWGEERPAAAVTSKDFAQKRRYGLGAAEGELDRRLQPGEVDVPSMAVEMAAGSVVVFAGTLWHGGGANRSKAPRLGASNQYCEPWARQQENFSLSLPPGMVATLSDRLQELIGYSIHPPFMGHAGGMHPRRLIGH